MFNKSPYLGVNKDNNTHCNKCWSEVTTKSIWYVSYAAKKLTNLRLLSDESNTSCVMILNGSRIVMARNT
jgi:hypothetical protein